MSDESQNCQECEVELTDETTVSCEDCGKLLCEDCAMSEGENNVFGGNALQLCTDCYAKIDHCHICEAACTDEAHTCSECGESACSDCMDTDEDDNLLCNECMPEDEN